MTHHEPRLIRGLQDDHHIWASKNFPDQFLARNAHQPLLGIVEEVGELSHAMLKFQQSIRGYDLRKFEAEAKDALGDIFIYMMSFCNVQEWDLQDIIINCWEEVRARDWTKNPVTGVSE